MAGKVATPVEWFAHDLSGFCNLDLTHRLIVAEAVMMGLALQLDRGEAHHVVKHACCAALTEGIALVDALAGEPTVTANGNAPRSSD